MIDIMGKNNNNKVPLQQSSIALWRLLVRTLKKHFFLSLSVSKGVSHPAAFPFSLYLSIATDCSFQESDSKESAVQWEPSMIE